MEDLQVRAPEAANHIAQASPEVQEQIAARILALSHVDLYTSSRNHIMETTKHSLVPPEEHSPQQQEQQSRVEGMMLDVSRLAKQSLDQIESRKTAGDENLEMDLFYGYEKTVFGVASSLALEEAVQAKETGDAEAAKKAIQNMLVLSLLSPGYKQREADVRDVVSKGMAPELVQATQGLEGVIAFTGPSDSPTDLPSILRPQASLLRLATNTDLDDQLQTGPSILSEEQGLEGISYRQKLVDGMEHSDLTALAKLETSRGNSLQAAQLGRASLDRLVADTAESYGYEESAEDIADTIAFVADELAPRLNPEHAAVLEQSLGALRRLRSAGLKPYRVNNPITTVLDKTIVLLAQNGYINEARSLISVSKHEIVEPGRLEDSKPGNLDQTIQYDFQESPEEKERVRKLILDLHTQKVSDFRQDLLSSGADGNTVQAILQNCTDPDAGTDITAEFWASYNNMLGVTPSPEPGYRPHEPHGQNSAIRELIEGQDASNIDQKAHFITTLIEAGLTPADIDGQILARLSKIVGREAQETYLQGITAVSKLLSEYQASPDGRNDRFFNHHSTFDALSQFADPTTALTLAKKVYGNEAYGGIYSLRTMLSDEYTRHDDVLVINPNTAQQLEYIADKMPGLLEDPGFVRAFVIPASVERFNDTVACIEQSDNLQMLSALVGQQTVVRELLLSGSSAGEQTAAIEAAFTGKFANIVQQYADIPGVDQALARLLFGTSQVGYGVQPTTPEDRASRIVELFETTDMDSLITTMPNRSLLFLQTLAANGFSTEYATSLSEALNSAGFAGLSDYAAQDFITDAAFEKFTREIISSKNPTDTLNQIVDLYTRLDFIQERVPVDFAAHLNKWAAFLETIPGGSAGEHMKKQIVARLALTTKQFGGVRIEDPTQAIRIFGEVIPLPKELETARTKSLALIQALLGADTVRGFPSTKPTKLKEAFYDQDLQQLYSELFILKQSSDGSGIVRFMTEHNLTADTAITNITDLVASAKVAVRTYRDQERSAPVWLKQFSGQDIKAVKLIEAWKSRSTALSYGVKDNPKDILSFVAEKGVQIYADQARERGQTDVTPQELEAEQAFISGMGARYAPETAFRAVERIVQHKRTKGEFPPKQVTAAARIFTINDEEFSAEILAADDPRGLTIGYDTGCCMTLGGASENCIWAGFEDARYSFFTVSDSNGRLRAQSVMYIAEVGDQKILVADNIETTAGTDLSKIAAVYKDALTSFAEEQGLDLDAIHIGKGYTPGAIIAALPNAKIAPKTPLAGTYSDAGAQKILWQREPAAPAPQKS